MYTKIICDGDYTYNEKQGQGRNVAKFIQLKYFWYYSNMTKPIGNIHRTSVYYKISIRFNHVWSLLLCYKKYWVLLVNVVNLIFSGILLALQRISFAWHWLQSISCILPTWDKYKYS